jgi:cytochrome c oxidase subunit 3
VTSHSERMTTGHGAAGAEHGGHDQGVNTALLGMLLFISSEIMFFAGLFAVYFNVRASHDPWPPEGFEIHPMPIALPATILLVLSSLTMQWAIWRIRKNDRTGMNRALAVTIVMGAIFLVAQLYDYTTLDFGIQSHVYGSLFYTLTGFHGAHVFGGLIGMIIILVRGMAGQFSGRHHAAVEAVSIYWHFVDVVWIALFATLYILH